MSENQSVNKGKKQRPELNSNRIYKGKADKTEWTADLLFPDKSYGRAILAFVFSLYGLIDFLTFFPYYLPIVFPMGAVAFRMFRVIRIFRLFRVNAQYDAFNVIINVLNDKKNQIISSVCMILIFMMAASLCMYSLEHEAQP